MSRWSSQGLLVFALAVAIALWVSSEQQSRDLAVPDRCGGVRFDMAHAAGGLSPYIRLQADGRSGAFLLDTASTASSLSAEAFGRAAGGRLEVQAFSLPSFPKGVFQLARYWGARQPSGGQLGVVGTDFLSLLSLDFVFRNEGSDVVVGMSSCDAVALRRGGLIGVSQAGFFSSDPRRIEPGHANVPVLYVRIGTVHAWAQIDTGYDDADLRPAIDINEALYQRLLQAGVALRADRDTWISTCEGSERRGVYHVAGPVVIETDTGLAVRELTGVNLIRKGANGCGGIGASQSPAAQLGVSALALLGRVVFDPKAETVWVPDPTRDTRR